MKKTAEEWLQEAENTFGPAAEEERPFMLSLFRAIQDEALEEAAQEIDRLKRACDDHMAACGKLALLLSKAKEGGKR